jgi:hypothetical protein
MTEQTARELIDFLNGYNNHFQEMQSFLSLKLQKVMEDDLTWLTESLKTEQKLVMKGNNIEDNRLKFLKEKGMEGWNSEKILEAVPENLKGRMTLEIDTMRKHIQRIKQLSDDILDIVERKLQIQAKLMKDKGILPGDTYNNSGSLVQTPTGNTFLGEV